MRSLLALLEDQVLQVPHAAGQAVDTRHDGKSISGQGVQSAPRTQCVLDQSTVSIKSTDCCGIVCPVTQSITDDDCAQHR